MVWLLSLLSVTAVSLVSLVGVLTVSMNEARLTRVVSMLVSFAVGALLGDAFIHLIPEAFSNSRSKLNASLLMLAGILLFFVVEKLLRHEHGLLHRYYHPQHHSEHHAAHGDRRQLALINVFGDAIHNFLDGVLIGSSYLVSPTLGVSTTIAVLFHEIPQELGDFGILVFSGLSVKRALLVNLATACVAILGTVVTLAVGLASGDAVSGILVPVAAGGFVYIAAANLIPELQHDRSLRALCLQAAFIGLGIAVMALLTLLD